MMTKQTDTRAAQPARRPAKLPLAERFHVAVDRQLKSGYATYKEAEDAALAIKQRHPRLDVTVYNAKDEFHTFIDLPRA
jgi:hypothetical protein